jgi:hypothetical protein
MILVISRSQQNGSVWLAVGLAHLIGGGELLRVIRPPRFRTLKSALSIELDWATPFLWIGSLCVGIAFKITFDGRQSSEIMSAMFVTAGVISGLTLRLKIARLPYIPALLTSLGLLIVGVKLFDQYYDRAVSTLLGYGLILAIGATLIRIGAYYLLRHTEVRLRFSILVWWIRPILTVSTGFAGLSSILLVTLSGLHGSYPLLKIATGVCLAIYAVSVFAHTKRLGWLWVALGLTWYTWANLLWQFGLTSVVWQTLPLGAAVMLMGKCFYPKTPGFDLIGCAVLLGGTGVSLDKSNLVSLLGLVLVLHVFGLGVYGYMAGRRIPFSLGMLSFCTGLLYAIARLNIWFIPLGGGIVLMMGALLIEVRHASIEYWLNGWRSRWQTWQ